MLDQNDIKQIGAIIKGNNKELVKEIVVQVGEMLEQQVLPQMSALDEKVTGLEGKIIGLPDKNYLDEKLADLKGGLVARARRQDEKVNSTLDLLQEKGTFIQKDVRRIKQEFQIFPSQAT